MNEKFSSVLFGGVPLFQVQDGKEFSPDRVMMGGRGHGGNRFAALRAVLETATPRKDSVRVLEHG
ncbi:MULTISPECIES: hypothetical protein [unclassified Thiocapsa]|uniref:hypothetical protein n=1 Tax=unclassified Thiocapsa TaxID=2641286 RepID=UPI0035B469FA